jgi:hypothetical protein
MGLLAIAAYLVPGACRRAEAPPLGKRDGRPPSPTRRAEPALAAKALEISLEIAQQGAGTIFHGKTNLPDGTKLAIELVEPRAGAILGQDFRVFVGRGEFSSAPFSDRGRPWLGPFRVRVFCYFMPAWQAPALLKKLALYSSPHIKALDPGLADSDRILEVVKDVVLPPAPGARSEGAEAISVVKQHYVVKEGLEFPRSAKPIGECVEEFTAEVARFSGTWVRHHGWRAEPAQGRAGVYDVFFEYEFGKEGVGCDPGTRQTAWFECDIRTRTVRPRNKNAVYSAWLPGY